METSKQIRPTPIQVNDSAITASAIAAEVQNHPSADPATAVAEASRALVIRELLLQRAVDLAIAPMPETDEAGRLETDEEAKIRQVLEAEVSVPEADRTSCHRYYENNRKRFASPVLYEATHILFAADPEDGSAYREAVRKAERVIAALADDKPSAMARMARELSDCPSGQNGGNLGQVARGDTVPEVETFLDNLDQGQLSPVPVKSRYGAHVLRLDRRIEGRQLPFDMVHDRIAAYLEEASWRRAVAQYIRLLAGQAAISGADLDAATSPLVR